MTALLILVNGCSNPIVTQDAKRSQAMLLADASDGNWPAYGGGYRETHYSPLTDINAGNVNKLGLTWSIDLPTQISTHSAPLAVDGVLYYATGLSIVTAVDAATGKPLWTYDPKVADVVGQKQRTGWGVRGIAWWNGKIFTGTQDGRLIAINAQTGLPAWSVQTTMGPQDGRYITGAPRVFNGKVIIGHGGADFAAVRGYVTAYDAETGKKLWRFFTVPGKPGTKDGEASDPVMEKAAKTWTGQWWKFGGGGTAWNAITYDPDYNRIYIGTGNGAPWNRAVRSPGGGDNLFLCSIVALDADTGAYVWHYQTTPGEQWDYNSAMDMELTQLKIGGKPRDVILHAPKNGFFYVLDRATGKLISAAPFGKVTWATGIDMKSGRPIESPTARVTDGKTFVWPAGIGAHNWQAMSYSPKTHLTYIPRQELTGYFSSQGIDPKSWAFPKGLAYSTGYAPMAAMQLPPASQKPLGSLVAWDPVAQKERWSVPMTGLVNGGILSTGGNLVFQGNVEGKFVAYDATTGKPLWSFEAQNGIIGQPISFRAGGKQYVTVMTGVGGVAGAYGNDAHRLGWDYRNQKRRLLTFAIGGTQALPEKTAVDVPLVDTKETAIDVPAAQQGSIRYANNCINCHGLGAVGGGSAPDLRSSQVILNQDGFRQIVQEGLLQQQGMPKFSDLSEREIESIRQYALFRARAGKDK
ncbi:MAG TPA: PQQ-dependent dehydrogenase, methanol/ethanol family [Sphingobium sp.]